MYRICKRFNFEASHYLPNVPETHQCKNLHGHSYKTFFYFESETLDKYGFVVDFLALENVKTWIKINLDHSSLNDILDNPTSELLAKFLFSKFKKDYPLLSKVRVSETSKTWGEYSECM